MPGQYFGKYTGIVKDNSDPEKLGHLKVTVPAIFPEDEEMVAVPALPYGFFFVPETDTKVWVEFEGGDPGYPLWTGVQYVKGDWAKEAEADPPTLRVVKTPGGHLLIFDDDAGSIELRLGDADTSLVLDDSGIALKDGNGNKITFASGGITIESSSDVKIKGSTVALN
jgi:hypothetical protein